MEVLLSQRSGDTWGGVPIRERNNFFTQISRNNFHEKKRHQNTQKTGINKNRFYKSYVFLKIFSSEFQQLTKKDKKNL